MASLALADVMAAPTYVRGQPRLGNAVVLPGLCVASYLRPACAALATLGYRAWLLEPPGWPGNPADREPVVGQSFSELTDSVVGGLEAHQLDRVVLVGQSMGAQIASHVAVRRPDLVRHLVLQGPVFEPTCRTATRALARWVADMPRERLGLAVREIPEWLRVGPRRLARMLRLSLSERLEHLVPDVGCPITVVIGERDTLCGPAWARELTSSGERDRLIVLEGLPHNAAYHDPELFGRVVTARAG